MGHHDGIAVAAHLLLQIAVVIAAANAIVEYKTTMAIADISCNTATAIGLAAAGVTPAVRTLHHIMLIHQGR